LNVRMMLGYRLRKSKTATFRNIPVAGSRTVPRPLPRHAASGRNRARSPRARTVLRHTRVRRMRRSSRPCLSRLR
jgi:hypothetical protein